MRRLRAISMVVIMELTKTHTLFLALAIEAGNLEQLIQYLEWLLLDPGWGRIHIEQQAARGAVRYGPTDSASYGQILDLSLICLPGEPTPTIHLDTLDGSWCDSFEIAQTLLEYYALWLRRARDADEASL